MSIGFPRENLAWHGAAIRWLELSLEKYLIPKSSTARENLIDKYCYLFEAIHSFAIF